MLKKLNGIRPCTSSNNRCLQYFPARFISSTFLIEAATKSCWERETTTTRRLRWAENQPNRLFCPDTRHTGVGESTNSDSVPAASHHASRGEHPNGPEPSFLFFVLIAHFHQLT